MITPLQVGKLRHRDVKEGPGDLLYLFSSMFWEELSSLKEQRGLFINF